jgi:hypothetical protein
MKNTIFINPSLIAGAKINNQIKHLLFLCSKSRISQSEMLTTKGSFQLEHWELDRSTSVYLVWGCYKLLQGLYDLMISVSSIIRSDLQPKLHPIIFEVSHRRSETKESNHPFTFFVQQMKNFTIRSADYDKYFSAWTLRVEPTNISIPRLRMLEAPAGTVWSHEFCLLDHQVRPATKTPSHHLRSLS